MCCCNSYDGPEVRFVDEIGEEVLRPDYEVDYEPQDYEVVATRVRMVPWDQNVVTYVLRRKDDAAT